MEKKVNLIKLCVGIDSLSELEERQSRLILPKKFKNPKNFTFHLTRMYPQREKEILSGGSLYWVIKGQILGRQKISFLERIKDENNIKRCLIVLEKKIYITQTLPRKPFQGWRYLEPEVSPKDVSIYNKSDEELPHNLKLELYKIGVL